MKTCPNCGADMDAWREQLHEEHKCPQPARPHVWLTEHLTLNDVWQLAVDFWEMAFQKLHPDGMTEEHQKAFFTRGASRTATLAERRESKLWDASRSPQSRPPFTGGPGKCVFCGDEDYLDCGAQGEWICGGLAAASHPNRRRC